MTEWYNPTIITGKNIMPISIWYVYTYSTVYFPRPLIWSTTMAVVNRLVSKRRSIAKIIRYHANRFLLVENCERESLSNANY